MVFERKVNAIPENADRLLTYFLANYLHNASKLLKGESRTKQPI